MTITPAPGLLEAGHEPPAPLPAEEKTPAYTIECSAKGCPAQPPSWPPCLVNLILDTSHPHHFALTQERLSTISGAPGSCLDAFKSHVAATVGTDAFLRAMGSVTEASLAALFGKALAAQGRSTSCVPPLAGMAAEAGLVLLADRIAQGVCARLETLDLVAGMLLADEGLRGLLLVRASEASPKRAASLLESFGLGSSSAKKVVKLLGPWIPQEITDPTSQSAKDVARAHGILVDGLEKARATIAGIEPDIRCWQVSDQIDPIADFGPEVQATLEELGIGTSWKGSALGQAVRAHVEQVSEERDLAYGVCVVADLVRGLARGRLTALVTAVPGLLADKKKLDDLVLLRGIGAASDEAVQSAREQLLTSIVALTVDVIL